MKNKAGESKIRSQFSNPNPSPRSDPRLIAPQSPIKIAAKLTDCSKNKLRTFLTN